MSTNVCSHFTQNAWKKDLCSNCFKSKDEHKHVSNANKFSSTISTNAKRISNFITKSDSDSKKTDYPNRQKLPTKSIIKKSFSGSKTKSKTHKVCFAKNLTEVIGYGGEWSDNDSDDVDDDDDFTNLGNERADTIHLTLADDEEALELKRITDANTNFNMNNGNLLGDATENIKKSFAALKLGAPQVDKEGKKQTLKINVMPFGATTKVLETNHKQTTTTNSSLITTKGSATKLESKSHAMHITTTSSISTTLKQQNNAVKSKATPVAIPAAGNNKVVATANNESDGKNSPPIERAMEKSLLDEISETLKSNKLQAEQQAKATATTTTTLSTTTNAPSQIKFEINSLNETLEQNKTMQSELKKPIARNAPITKEHAKPKINVFHKYSDTDSNCSDGENGISAYYDVVEPQLSYENLPDGKCEAQEGTNTNNNVAEQQTTQPADKAMYSSSQYITDMLLSSKTRAASYNLHEGNFITSKITQDGLIVTKCASDDALDSTGSSFDGSSDEETSYNMTRSESDSGIGISIGHDYKNLHAEQKQKEHKKSTAEKKLSASTNNSDYEDIQVNDSVPVLLKSKKMTTEESPKSSSFSLDKCRELHGEPDGSADPDGSLESNAKQVVTTKQTVVETQQPPALPKSPPPTLSSIDARPSFLHGLQPLKKPDLPVKPIVPANNTPLKTFLSKRQPTNVELQVISQLQKVISKSNEQLNNSNADTLSKDDAKLKKGRAPNPPPEQKTSAPPTPERDYNVSAAFEAQQTQKIENNNETAVTVTPKLLSEKSSSSAELRKSTFEPKTENNFNTGIYMRKQIGADVAAKSFAASPVIREKDKRERATINPKFRSLNTFMMQRNNVAKNLQLQTATSSLSLKHSMAPEPAAAKLTPSMSEECLAATTSAAINTSTVTAQLQKPKAKFSIKKFLRMGASKTTDSLHKKDGIYSEICTGEETGVVGKPRLVIIHPIDINPTAVEVVKDITKTSDVVTAQTIAVVTAKPPAPPLRNADGQRAQDVNKPARPPPPKSAEMRRKQQKVMSTTTTTSTAKGATTDVVDTAGFGSMKCKSDNVYANLGEIRSSIAPRKPERTASMREREAQLELARKRHSAAQGNENNDTVSICSSNGGDNVSTSTADTKASSQKSQNSSTHNTGLNVIDGKPPAGAFPSLIFERKKSDTKMIVAKKLEIFENRSNSNNFESGNSSNNDTLTSAHSSSTSNISENGRPNSLKDSVRNLNSTIDSYLKDKREYENTYDFVKSSSTPPPPPIRSIDLNVATNRLMPTRRHNHFSDTASVTSCTRSEYGPVRNCAINNSLANIPRMISASYCGSEIGDFDIYAPYSYYGSEAGGDISNDINDSVWGVPSTVKNRNKTTNRLRMRKGRSVVHKTIEDNYSAVVGANLEALAQVLAQLQQTPIIPAALRPLANAINLRFEDFTILEGAQAFVVGKKAFHAAVWTAAPVTLALSADCNQLSGVAGELQQLSGGVCGVLNPITEFCDLVPSYQLPLMPSTEVTMLQATISVLPRLQLDTLQSIGSILKGKSQLLDKSNFNFRGSIPNLTLGLREIGSASCSALRNVYSVQNLSTLNEECSLERQGQMDVDNAEVTTLTSAGMPAFDDVMTREVAFIMLQLVNGMKNLQAKAIEEMPLSLANVVLSKDQENKDAQARLCVLQGNNNDEDEPMGTLCKCAYVALTEMLPQTKVTPILADILQQERAESLSKAKSVLEFILWGPSDVVLSGSTKERETALQRWLDLERATVLHGLVRTRVELTIYDECHLMFLVRSSVKMMNDAANIICSYQQQASNAESAAE